MHLQVLFDIAGSVGAAAVLFFATVTWRRLRRLWLLLDDWHGEPPRPGVPARPGVMVRLASIEAELYPNGGTSLKDLVVATAGEVQVLRHEVALITGGTDDHLG
ncbi:MAG: hypothetical protein HYR62_01855 [Actinobacteria bacterium]|nr:hypothetical protein [Actinomycetota bacterium]MBI3687227.1 hypothetical protein [Actinomycetota bacterium]